MLRQLGCPDCEALTSGDCGKHGPQIFGIVSQTPNLCPVCNGRGSVPLEWYLMTVSGVMSQMLEVCRSCQGIGFIRR